MAENKPKVVAFYREHPTVRELAEALDKIHRDKTEASKFHQKALEKLRAEAEKEGKEAWAKLNAELVRLGLITQEEIDHGHLHLDTDTMTIQRCSGSHLLADLLGLKL